MKFHLILYISLSVASSLLRCYEQGNWHGFVLEHLKKTMMVVGDDSLGYGDFSFSTTFGTPDK